MFSERYHRHEELLQTTHKNLAIWIVKMNNGKCNQIFAPKMFYCLWQIYCLLFSAYALPGYVCVRFPYNIVFFIDHYVQNVNSCKWFWCFLTSIHCIIFSESFLNTFKFIYFAIFNMVHAVYLGVHFFWVCVLCSVLDFIPKKCIAIA